jgi:integrase/recombinase XerD
VSQKDLPLPYLTLFLHYLASEKGLSTNTLQAYRRDITAFLLTCPLSDLTECREKRVYQHLQSLQQQGYATSTMARHIISLKVFFRFLLREALVDYDLAIYLETPKVWQLIPEILTPDEVDRLLQSIEITTPLGARDRAIFELLYATGIRVSELCGLTLSSFYGGQIKVLGKGNKERMVPVGQEALKAIDHYLLHHRPLTSHPKAPLFLSRKDKPLRRETIWKKIQGYAKKAGITKPLSPHTLRHCFASHLLTNGADLRLIQEMLGHENIATTERYTHIDDTYMHQAFTKYHPRP